jgi:hypothetical protein
VGTAFGDDDMQSTTSSAPVSGSPQAQPDIFIPQSAALVSLPLLNVLFEYICAGYSERLVSRKAGPFWEPSERRAPRESLALLGLRVDTALRYFSVAGPCFLKPKTVADMFGLPRQRWKLVQDWLAAKGLLAPSGTGAAGRCSCPPRTSCRSWSRPSSPCRPPPSSASRRASTSTSWPGCTQAEDLLRDGIAKGYLIDKRRSVIPLCGEIWDGKLGLGDLCGCGYARARSAFRRLDALGFLDAKTMRLTPMEGHKRAWHGRSAFDMLKNRAFGAMRGERGQDKTGGQDTAAEAAQRPRGRSYGHSRGGRRCRRVAGPAAEFFFSSLLFQVSKVLW